MIKREEANEENVKGNPAAQTSPRRLPYVPAAFYWAAIFLFAASLMAKPMLVTLPFLLLLLDFWPLGRLEKLSFRFLLGKDRRMLVEKVPFLALSAASCLVTIAVQRKAMVYYHALPFAYRMQNAAVSYVRYLGKALWPRNLSIVYPNPRVGINNREISRPERFAEVANVRDRCILHPVSEWQRVIINHRFPLNCDCDQAGRGGQREERNLFNQHPPIFPQ